MPESFKEAIAKLDTAPATPTDDLHPEYADMMYSKSPADRQRIYVIAARYMFAGEPDKTTAAAIGKTVRTVVRLRKDEGFLTYFAVYCRP